MNLPSASNTRAFTICPVCRNNNHYRSVLCKYCGETLIKNPAQSQVTEKDMVILLHVCVSRSMFGWEKLKQEKEYLEKRLQLGYDQILCEELGAVAAQMGLYDEALYYYQFASACEPWLSLTRPAEIDEKIKLLESLEKSGKRPDLEAARKNFSLPHLDKRRFELMREHFRKTGGKEILEIMQVLDLFEMSTWTSPTPDAFISYSRRNGTFVKQLTDSLTAKGKRIWLDQTKEPLIGITPGSKWWNEIRHGIETADNFLFVISPDAVSSPYCNAEVSHAIQSGKRVITVLDCSSGTERELLALIGNAIQNIPDETLPGSIAAAGPVSLQYIARQNWLHLSQIEYVPFSKDRPFDESLERTIAALDVDLAWVKQRSQLQQAARLWQENGCKDAYLWPDERLREITGTNWRSLPQLSKLELDFLRPEQERLIKELDLSETNHARRNEIGLRLNSIGDTRRGVGIDPTGLPDIEWISVKKGRFELWTNDDNFGYFKVQDFYIAKYPITFSQFSVFINAKDGYHNQAWWEGFTYKKRKPQESTFNYGNFPRIHVNWYEAVAFCRWLNARLGLLQMPLKPSLKQLSAYPGIRLPTEWEWQWAAQGPDGRLHPWGTGVDGYRNNTFESSLRKLVSVGLYPAGAAPCGALDMSGNVCEWCLNEVLDIKKIDLDSDKTGDSQRTLRGGSWGLGFQQAMTGYRHYSTPDTANEHFGFRIMIGKLPNYLQDTAGLAASTLSNGKDRNVNTFRHFQKEKNGEQIADLGKLYEKGLSLMYEDKFIDAIEVFLEGERLADSQQDEYWEMEMSLSQGVCWGMVDEPGIALMSLNTAMKLAEKKGDIYKHAMILMAMGKAHANLGENQEALNTFEKCAKLMKESGKNEGFMEAGKLIQEIRARRK
jgi:formylglycine-generating enzyme required for sulfatase activity